jgi:DNA invertase Pin-like site-specific DNA recombinase
MPHVELANEEAAALLRLVKRRSDADRYPITPLLDPVKAILAHEMQRAGAGLRSIAEPVVDTASDFADLVRSILGVAAKLERRRILERTARARADAKAKGVKFGRKPTPTLHQQNEARKRV